MDDPRTLPNPWEKVTYPGFSEITNMGNSQGRINMLKLCIFFGMIEVGLPVFGGAFTFVPQK